MLLFFLSNQDRTEQSVSDWLRIVRDSVLAKSRILRHHPNVVLIRILRQSTSVMFAVTHAFPTRLRNVGLRQRDKLTLLLLLLLLLLLTPLLRGSSEDRNETVSALVKLEYTE